MPSHDAQTVRRTQRSRSEATRGALIAAARTLFGAAGYLGTSTADLVAAAAVTRGALYHHFADKERLFDTVAIAVAHEISETASGRVAATHATIGARFISGLHSYLELVADRPEAQRILLIDGPAVLGWARWRAIQSEVMLPPTVAGIRKLMEEGHVRPGDATALAHLILAALNDAALMIANAPDPRAAYDPVADALVQLVGGLTGHRTDARPFTEKR